MKFLIPVFILAIILSGCANLATKSSNSTTNPAYLEPKIIARFADVPVPAGFNLIPQDSYSFESSGIRVAALKYQGKSDPDLVVNFYKEQMAIYNWNLLNIVEYGQRMLNFDRENESCIVTLIAKGKAVSILISLGPKSQYPKNKIDKPLK
mgnify:CR=1 FL=1